MNPIDKEDLKVVAHLRGGGMVKGYLDLPPDAPNIDLRERAVPLPDQISVRSESGNRVTAVDVHALKALFFVKRFDGRREYREVKFFTVTPEIEGLWVRVSFFDGETTEGVVHNSIHYLISPGFFLKPPDPLSNNEMTYVIKTSLTEFRVLGVKSRY